MNISMFYLFVACTVFTVVSFWANIKAAGFLKRITLWLGVLTWLVGFGIIAVSVIVLLR